METYYRASNKFSPVSFIYFIIACIAGIPIITLIYSYAIWYIPLPYINFFITIGFGYFIGWIVQKLAINLGKVRNNSIAYAFGFLGALIGLYLSWVVWVDLVINAGESYRTDRFGVLASNIKFIQVLELALQPSLLFDLMGQIMDVGVWGISGATVSGWFLGAIWIIEALIVLIIGILIPSGKSSEPFCELNNKWFDEKQLPAFTYLEPEMRSVVNLENNNFEALKGISTVANSKTQSHSLFTLYANETDENYLSITNKTASKGKKGETRFTDNYIVTHLRINESFSDFLKSIN